MGLGVGDGLGDLTTFRGLGQGFSGCVRGFGFMGLAVNGCGI